MAEEPARGVSRLPLAFVKVSIRCLIFKALGELLVERKGACAGTGEQKEDEGIQRRLLEVVRVVFDVAKGEALEARRR